MTLCRQEGATPFMALLAVWQVLLARYSGQDDITVGSPIAGRTRTETEGLIGFFVNTLVLRTHVRPGLRFRELLAQVRATTLGAYEHQDVPFEKLVEELKPQRSLSHTPLFQVMLSLQNLPVANRTVESTSDDSAPLHLESFAQELQVTKFDLTLTLSQTPEGLAGGLSYRVDLFEEATIARWVEHLNTLLEAAITAPDTLVGELPMLPVEERRQVLVEWNDTRRELPWTGAFHERFEAQAALTPDALAVLDDSSSLSFLQLNQRANQLAHLLRSRGVGPEVRVAFCLERSVDALVALLAILKAGAAYVPLDSAYPRERLAFMLQDSGAPFVLTQSHLLPRLDSASTQALCLDDDALRASLAALPDSNPPRLTLLSHLAYVIYTSGSTGRPKGVMVHHSSVVNLLSALSSSVYADVQRPLRISLNAPLSFDASVKQLVFLSLGHCLCFVPQAAREDVPLLLSWLRKHQLDVLDCAPSHLRLLLDEGLTESGRPLRVLIGGEAIDDSLWATLSASPSLSAFNVYGPTEATVDTTALAIRASERPSLGGPLSNVSTFILDASLQPAPIGVPGELFIGGDGLARGYHLRPDLTAERFVPNPFSSVPGARLYRTGDKARWLAHGHLEYPGLRRHLGSARGAAALPPRVHGALGLRRPGLLAHQHPRQARQEGAPRSRLRSHRLLRRASQSHRDSSRRHLGGSPPPRLRQRHRRLLLPRWPLPPRHPGRLSRPQGLRRRAAPARALRGTDRRGARGSRRCRGPRRLVAPAAPARGGASDRADSAVLRAAAPVVPRQAPAGQSVLQHPLGHPAPQRAEPRCVGARDSGARAAP